jgi:flagellar hook-associated protein 3 FlgL
MRITSGMMVQNMLKNINNNLVKLSELQYQSSSQKKIEVPSDAPVVASKSLKLKSYLAQIEQQQKNAEDASSWMSYTDTALGEFSDILTSIREVTVEAANGTLTENELNDIGVEIEELEAGIIDVANSSYAGRYIFAGYSTDSAPFEIVSTDVGDLITYNGKYLSLGGAISSSISDIDIETFYMDNMNMISGQPELTSANFNSFTATSPELDFTITLDGVTSSISLIDGTTYDIDSITTELQSQINTAFPSSTGQPNPIIEVSKDDGKIVLAVQDGSSISINSDTLNISQLGFSDGMESTEGDSEEILYKLGSSNQIAVNVEGCNIFGEGEDCLFNTITKLKLALSGETEYKTAIYNEGPPAEVTIETHELDISILLDDLDVDINRLLAERADLGARTSYVELTQNRLEDNFATFSELLSNNDNVDIAEVSINLTSAEVAYTASLSAGAKIIQNSLLDFLS